VVAGERRRFRNSTFYRRVSWAWRWWGWVADHFGRVALVVLVFSAILAATQFIWGQFMSDWPGYAMYATTILTIGLGAQLVLLAVLVGRGQVTVMVENVAVTNAARHRAMTDWAGLRWMFIGSTAAPFCPQHTMTRLLFARDGDKSNIWDHVPDHSLWTLVCPDDGTEDLRFDGAPRCAKRRYDAARAIATERLRALGR